MSEWREYKISDIADVIGGGTPKTSIEEYWNGDIPWLAPRDLTGYNKVYISHGYRFITVDGLKKSSTKLMPKGAVLLTSRAPIGYVAIAENEICTNQGFKSLVPKQDKCTSEFLYYWIKNSIDYLQQLGTGTTFAEISGSVVKSIEISLPQLEEQKAIAEVLSSLDDKIDLLHRQNKTLEELAQTLFRQWFIEEAKDEWEKKPLGDFCIKITKGTTPTTLKKQFVDRGINFIKVNCIDDNGNYLEDKFNYIDDETNELLNRSKLQKGDILYSIAGTIGRISVVPEEILPANVNQALAILRIDKNKINPNYIRYCLKDKNITFELHSKIVHAVQPNLSLGEISNTLIPLADENTLNKFSLSVDSLEEKIEQNKQQIKTLENMRDTLLPKLMSGEVRVKE